MIKFVGFAESPKPPQGADLKEFSFTVETNQSQDAVAARLFAKSTAGAWLGEFTKYELTPGGKALFADATRPTITFTAVNLPRQVTLICDPIGQLEIEITKSATKAELKLRFSRWVLAEELGAFEDAAKQTADRLKAALEVRDGR